MTRSFKLLLPSIFLLSLGCGKSTPAVPLAPVSGRVQLDGKPLAKATVQFHPIEEGKTASSLPDSYGDTDEQGNYTLKAADGREGAVIGKHKVSISVIDRERKGPGGINVLPDKFNKATTLTFDVAPEGSKEANFPLKLK